MNKTYIWKYLAPGFTIIIASLMAWLISQRWEEITNFSWHIHYGYLSLVIIFHSLALGVTYWVWHLMISHLSGFGHAITNFRFYYISTLAKRIPTSLPYIGTRLALYKQVNVSRVTVINAIAFETILIGIAGVFTFLVFTPFYTNLSSKLTSWLTIIGLGIFLLLFVRPQLFNDITDILMKRLGKGRMKNVPKRIELFKWLGLYILPWIFAGFSLYFAPKALTDHSGPGLLDALAISTLATLVALLSTILPSGFGLKELTTSALLANWMPFSNALLIALAYRLLHTLNEIVWALIANFLPHLREKIRT